MRSSITDANASYLNQIASVSCSIDPLKLLEAVFPLFFDGA
jgi:hypothetical protein